MTPHRITVSKGAVAAIGLWVCLWPARDATAAAAGAIEALRSPAWVERAGERTALRPGMALADDDRVLTGAGARVRIRLIEGSRVKLGENAEFHLRALDRPPAGGGAFAGFLDVLKGAFRFTTSLISQRHRRNLGIRVAGVTAGIRGTDIWGKAAPDRDIVCLIEGEVTVTRGDDPAITMSEPLTFYIAPKNAPPLPVAPVDPAQLARWATETEIPGAVRAGRAYRVHIASLRSAANAAAVLRRLDGEGLAADLQTVDLAGTTWYRISVPGFDNVTQASEFAAGLADRRLADTPWVGPN